MDCAGVSAADLTAVLALLTGTDIAEIDITTGSTRLSVRRRPLPVAAPAPAAPPQEPLSLAIASPLVGIFRASVAPGDVVLSGQPIGAVEALGMPTNVDAPQGGTVEDLLVRDGSPVEYGQPLLILRRSTHAP